MEKGGYSNGGVGRALDLWRREGIRLVEQAGFLMYGVGKALR